MKYLVFALLSHVALAQDPCGAVPVAQEGLRQAQARLEVGEADRLEVLRAEIEVANSQLRCDGDRAAWCAQVLPLRREVVAVTSELRAAGRANAEQLRIAQRAVLGTQKRCE